MSTDTIKPANGEAVPFFARFLAEQATASEEDTPPPPAPPSSPFPPFTFKFPSDWEDPA